MSATGSKTNIISYIDYSNHSLYYKRYKALSYLTLLLGF